MASVDAADSVALSRRRRPVVVVAAAEVDHRRNPRCAARSAERRSVEVVERVGEQDLVLVEHPADTMTERAGRTREHDDGTVGGAIHRPHDSHRVSQPVTPVPSTLSGWRGARHRRKP